jgi:hypothetical protein
MNTDKTDEKAGASAGDAQVYIERSCRIEHEGRTFECGGAVVTPEAIVAYPRAGGVLGDWHGRPIGTWRAVSRWKTPRSSMSLTMSQIEAVVNGITYTGRGAGEEMIFKGKVKRS